jgi:hypothetical protein
MSTREDVTKEFLEKRKVEFNVNTKVDLYPIVILAGGDTEWITCAIGKENITGQHCSHCQRSQKDFMQGLGDPWTVGRQGIKRTLKLWIQNNKESNELTASNRQVNG